METSVTFALVAACFCLILHVIARLNRIEAGIRELLAIIDHWDEDEAIDEIFRDVDDDD